MKNEKEWVETKTEPGLHDDHYKTSSQIETIVIQEMIAGRLDRTGLTAQQKLSVIVALKYVCRMGRKKGENAGKEADKTANYLHRAITGKWIK